MILNPASRQLSMALFRDRGEKKGRLLLRALLIRLGGGKRQARSVV
jgi:hypothetical protein